MIVDLTKEEIEDILINLKQCISEGYLSYGDPAFNGMTKLYEQIEKFTEMRDKYE